MTTAQTTDLAALRRQWHPLRVARIVEETHDARSIVFEIPPALAPVFGYRAGQFLTLQVAIDGVTLKRSYSLASSPDVDAEHKVTVKRVRDGRVSNWLHDRLRAGDVVPVLPPEGRFVLTDRADAPVLMFAGGSGITPVISIVKSALATTRRPVRVLYANRDARSIIFARELEDLVQRARGRLQVLHRLDDQYGFLGAAEVPRYLEGLATADCYICGPGPFMDVTESALLAAGVPGERVHIERFVSPADPKPAAAQAKPAVASTGAPATVRIELEGKTHEVPYAPGKTLLRAALDAGLDAPYSCEEGFCGCCMAQLLEGQVTMDADDALSNEEKKRGLVLACQSRPTTPRCAIRFAAS